MTTFTWDKNFETGLVDIDHQHQELVNLINAFSTSLSDDKVRYEDLETLINDLADYANYHFTEEEQLMVKSGLDSRHIKQHMLAHKNFLAEVVNIKSGISPENSEMARYLQEFLVHWLGYHILGMDQNMSRQLALIKSGVEIDKAYDIENEKSDSSTEPLIKALNGLFEQVSRRNKQLIEFNRTLESRIEERTQELSETNRRLEKISLTDVLTQLPNRRSAMSQLSLLWAESIKNETDLACIMIDADHFKLVNDSCGHDAGDKVLVELAKTLRDSFRTDDFVGRLGGDEFLVICPQTHKAGARQIAESTLETVSHLTVATGGNPWKGSISIGVAIRSRKMKSYEELIKAADRAVYAAKQAGKKCVRIDAE